MKQKFIKFFKDKFNIALLIIQLVGIMSYFLSKYMFFFVVFFFAESTFFVLLGVRLLVKNRDARYGMEIYDQLPYTESQKVEIRKKSESNAKNNKIMAIMLILLGIVLFGSSFSVIFQNAMRLVLLPYVKKYGIMTRLNVYIITRTFRDEQLLVVYINAKAEVFV